MECYRIHNFDYIELPLYTPIGGTKTLIKIENIDSIEPYNDEVSLVHVNTIPHRIEINYDKLINLLTKLNLKKK